MARHRIRSNVVSPGFVLTPANEASYRNPETAAARQRLIPAGRVALPADLANVILLLSSARADCGDGQDIHVDGGVGTTLMNPVLRAGRRQRRLSCQPARMPKESK